MAATVLAAGGSVWFGDETTLREFPPLRATHCATGAPHLLVWDNAPPHHTHAARDAATAAGITIGWLPFRSPELNPCEDIWREMKRVVAANRAYESVDELAERGMNWLDDHSPDALLHIAGLRSSKFDWLPT